MTRISTLLVKRSLFECDMKKRNWYSSTKSWFVHGTRKYVSIQCKWGVRTIPFVSFHSKSRRRQPLDCKKTKKKKKRKKAIPYSFRRKTLCTVIYRISMPVLLTVTVLLFRITNKQPSMLGNVEWIMSCVIARRNPLAGRIYIIRNYNSYLCSLFNEYPE